MICTYAPKPYEFALVAEMAETNRTEFGFSSERIVSVTVHHTRPGQVLRSTDLIPSVKRLAFTRTCRHVKYI